MHAQIFTQELLDEDTLRTSSQTSMTKMMGRLYIVIFTGFFVFGFTCISQNTKPLLLVEINYKSTTLHIHYRKTTFPWQTETNGHTKEL